MTYNLFQVSGEICEALAAEIERDREELSPDHTTQDHQAVWLRSAFWPILARVLRDHGVDDETGEDLRWMLSALVRLEGSQGWDRGFEAARRLARK